MFTMTESRQSSDDLGRRSEAGDREAFGELLDRSREQLEAWVRLRLGSRLRTAVDPSDICQETMLRALRSAGGFQWQGERALSNWLARIAENVVQEQVRRSAKEGLATLGVDPAASAISPSRAARRDERFGRLREALEALDPVSRRVVELSRLERRSLKEIAALVDRSPNAVGLVLMRALREMRRHLGETDSLGLPDRALDIGDSKGETGNPCRPEREAGSGDGAGPGGNIEADEAPAGGAGT
jgi:RNA polymerase sigma-70 factor (ECF subfamily)